MDSQPPVTFDDDDIVWKTATSENGVSFEIGVKKGEESTKEKTGFRAAVADNQFSALGKKDFRIAVHRPAIPVSKAKWITTTDDVKTIAAIPQYILYEQPWPSLYTYYLRIENTEHYFYYFEDEEGDKYPLNTFVNTLHLVRFNSKKPTIVYVSGS